MRIARRTLISGLCTLALALTASCKKKPSDSTGDGGTGGSEIVIGHYASMTGSTAHFGQDTDRGVRLAIEEANAKGGVLGKKIRVVTLDTRGDSAEAASAVSRLIDVEKVTALLGEVASSLSLAGGRVAQRRKIPMISPTSTNPKVNRGRRLHFSRVLHRSVPRQGHGDLRAPESEARQGRDPEGREERLFDRPSCGVRKLFRRARRNDRGRGNRTRRMTRTSAHR